MISNFKIERANLCRRCLSKVLNINLKGRNCDYLVYQQLCPMCHQMRHIVVGIRWYARVFVRDRLN